MQEPRELTIREAGERMKAGKLTAERLVESCLERIHAREDTIHAWVEVYEQEALAEARRCDRELQEGKPRGPLHGIPLGVKDIIDVRGQYTRCGTPVYPATVPGEDALAVARLRNAGAIFLGKTETTPFANNDPTITRNPWNPEHTPGGSSSGSGAAVADRMCPAALGTQTGGSLLRPAAYNGIVGFKATYGGVSTEGVLPNSWSIDHVGFHCRSVADAAILWPCMREEEPRPFARMPEPPLCSRAGTPGRRRVWAISASFSRRRPPPRCWKTSPPSGNNSSGQAPRSSRSPAALLRLRDSRLGHHQTGGALRLPPAPLRGLPGRVSAEAQGPPGKGGGDRRPRVRRTPPHRILSSGR